MRLEGLKMDMIMVDQQSGNILWHQLAVAVSAFAGSYANLRSPGQRSSSYERPAGQAPGAPYCRPDSLWRPESLWNEQTRRFVARLLLACAVFVCGSIVHALASSGSSSPDVVPRAIPAVVSISVLRAPSEVTEPPGAGVASLGTSGKSTAEAAAGNSEARPRRIVVQAS
jgi:hypothetical protein